MFDKEYMIEQLKKAGPFEIALIKQYTEQLTPKTTIRVCARINAPFSLFVYRAMDVLYEKGEISRRSRSQFTQYAVSYLISSMMPELKATNNSVGGGEDEGGENSTEGGGESEE